MPNCSQTEQKCDLNVAKMKLIVLFLRLYVFFFYSFLHFYFFLLCMENNNTGQQFMVKPVLGEK